MAIDVDDEIKDEVEASRSSQWWVYMIETHSGKLYTGISTDIERRFLEHRDNKAGRAAKFFRSDSPRAVVYREAVNDRSEASRRESAIKKMSRPQKILLVASS